MSIDPSIKLPKDTVAVIASESLLGGKYMSLQPGGDPDEIQPGGRIDFTQSTPGLEQLLGQVIFSMQQGGGQPAAGEQGQAPQPATPPAAPGAAAPAPGGLLGN
jgi:phospholipid/cholesterol/gamma-HCH transport system substrate-binding protein